MKSGNNGKSSSLLKMRILGGNTTLKNGRVVNKHGALSRYSMWHPSKRCRERNALARKGRLAAGKAHVQVTEPNFGKSRVDSKERDNG